jgi:ammonia channel protein AmtB
MQPGLAFFYGGLVPRKSVLTIMMQVVHENGNHLLLNRCRIYYRAFTVLDIDINNFNSVVSPWVFAGLWGKLGGVGIYRKSWVVSIFCWT